MDDIRVKRDKDISQRVIIFLLFLYLVTQPFYLWSSGYPQIADMIGVILLISVIIKYGLGFRDKFAIVSLLLVVYILFVNLIWGIVLNEQYEGVLSTSWYTFNVLIMLVIITIFRSDKIPYKVIKYAVIIAIILELISVFILPSVSIRAHGTFNNPNQLGYFSVLYLSLFYIVIKKIRVNNIVFWTITISALILALNSLSKATMLSLSVLVFIELLVRFNKIKLLKTFIVTIIFTVILTLVGEGIYDYMEETELYWNVKERLLDIGENKDDNPSGRGYDRIVNQPQYLLLGAGEVNVNRFESINNELHSTIGNLLFSYGIIGLTLFLLLLFILLRKNSFVYFYPLIPLFMYSITHNGIRNTVFWIVLALIYCFKVSENLSLNKDDK